MTDAQMLQNLLDVYDSMVFHHLNSALPELKEVIAELRRRIELEGTK